MIKEINNKVLMTVIYDKENFKSCTLQKLNNLL